MTVQAASSGAQEAYKYWAFISYSHRDKASGEWLHRSLEAYPVPKPLHGRPSRVGPIPARFLPIFRDREELAAAPDLGDRIERALRQSRYLIVVCSPASATSPWVNKEIAYFKSLGREDRVFSLIVAGEPYASERPGQPGDECFPEALRFRCGPDGRLSDIRAEPLAADLRTGTDGRQNALLRLMAGMLEVGFDDLRQRHLEARNARLRKVVGASLALALVFAALAVYAFMQQRLADERSRVALSRQLAVQSSTLLQTSPDLPLLLSLEALFAKDTVEARRSLFDALMATRKPIAYVRPPVKMVLDEMAISQDGKTLVTGGREGQLVFWDVSGGTPQPQVERAGTRVNALATSQDGRLLAVADVDGVIALWDLPSRRRLDSPGIPKQPAAVDALAFGPGNLLAFGYSSDESFAAVKIHVWDLAAQRVVLTLDSHADASVSDLAFSPDGRMLASSAVGGDTILWDLATGQEVHSDFLKDTGSVAFSPDGRWLASGSWELTVRKTESFEAVTFPLPDAPTHIAGVRFSPDGRFLASAAHSGNVILWSLETRTPREPPLQLKMGPLSGLVLSPDGRTLYAAADDGQIAIVWLEAAPLRTVLRTGAYVGAIGFNRVSGELAASDGKGSVGFWDGAALELRRKTPPSANGVHAFAISPDGETLAVGDGTGRLSFWDTKVVQARSAPAQVKADRIAQLAFAPDGQAVAVVGFDREVVIWDVKAGERFPKVLSGDSQYVRQALFSLDGSRLYTVGDDGDLLQWDWRAGERIGSPMKNPPGSDALALSPDGALLAVGDYDGRITLWAVQTGRVVGVPLTGHTHIVRALAFSPDGGFLASGGDDGAAILWDLRTRQPIAEFRHGLFEFSGDGTARSPRAVQHVSFSPNGTILAADGPANDILLWDVDVASWKRQACQRINRNLSGEEWSRYIGETEYRETCPGGRPRN